MSRKLREDEAQAICLLCGWTKTVELKSWLPDGSPSLAASELLLEHRRLVHHTKTRAQLARVSESPNGRTATFLTETGQDPSQP